MTSNEGQFVLTKCFKSGFIEAKRDTKFDNTSKISILQYSMIRLVKTKISHDQICVKKIGVIRPVKEKFAKSGLFRQNPAMIRILLKPILNLYLLTLVDKKMLTAQITTYKD